jgi:hypothetical protein
MWYVVVLNHFKTVTLPVHGHDAAESSLASAASVTSAWSHFKGIHVRFLLRNGLKVLEDANKKYHTTLHKYKLKRNSAHVYIIVNARPLEFSICSNRFTHICYLMHACKIMMLSTAFQQPHPSCIKHPSWDYP